MKSSKLISLFNYIYILNLIIILMSFIYFGNVPASVPPVLDTTPCMKQMLQYEDCVIEYIL
jgi:hypothetical protein